MVKKHAFRSDRLQQSVSWLNSNILSAIFRQQVLEMMVQKHRLSPSFTHKISHWRHSGFQVYCSQTVEADDRQALERLAAYILRPRIALLISHIPDPGTQMVRYDGWYSNASRGKRRLAGQAVAARAPSDEPETEADCLSRARRQNWARLLRRIYEVDPFTLVLVAWRR